MKKLLKSLALVAASALAVVSCQKNELQESPITEDEVFFTLTTADHLSDVEEGGKTYMEIDNDGNYKPCWEKGDELGAFLKEFKDGRSSYDMRLENTGSDGTQAIFKGSTTSGIDKFETSGTLYAYYPKSIQMKTYKNNVVGFDIPAIQHPTATSFDPAADLLISKPVSYELPLPDPTTEKKDRYVQIEGVQFARALAILRLNLYTTYYKPAQGKHITKLTVKGNNLGGHPKFNITDPASSAKIIEYGSTSSSVSAEYTGETSGAVSIGNAKGEGGYVFLVVAPVNLVGKKLVVEGEIEGYTFTKTIESLPLSFVLNPGRVLPVAVDLKDNFKGIKPDTRLYVEGFDKCTVKAGKQYLANETGVFGFGVTDALNYVYSVGNCNIRINNQGKFEDDPYLYIDDVDHYFRIQKLSITEETKLSFSAWVKENGTLSVKTRPSGSEDTPWEEFGEIISTTKGTVHAITSANSFSQGYYDFELKLKEGKTGYLRVDDIVIDVYDDSDSRIGTPNNVSAKLDDNKNNTIIVSWEAVDGAGSYEVQIKNDSSFDSQTTEETSISFVGLDYETDYTVSVKAISSDSSVKDSDFSEPVQIRTGVKTVDWESKSFTDLAEGDEVVVVGIMENGDSYALADNPEGMTFPPAVSITFTNGVLDSAPADNIVWTVGVSGDNRIFYTDCNMTKWLFCNTTASSSPRVGNGDRKEFTWENSYMKNPDSADPAKDLYIGVYNSDHLSWHAHTDYSSTVIKNQAFKFFVKDDSRTALDIPVITVTPSSIDKKISVSWTQVTGAASYKVTCTGQEAKTIEETSCNFTELTPGEYTVTVTAVAQPGTSYKDSQAASKTVTIEDTTPVISYTDPGAAAADQTTVEFAYEITRPRKDVELQVTKVDEAVDWITGLSVDSENKKVSVTLTANTTSVARKAQLKLSYEGAEDKTLYINQNGVVTKVYASLAELVEDGEPTGKTVTVTINDAISRVSSKNLFFNVGGREIEIYCNANHPTEWGTVKAEGKISGTITCPWQLYSTTWELAPADWTGLSYTAPLEPCATPVITISDQGSATIECATAGATVYYAVSDTEPTEFTQEYTGAVSLSDGQTIWAQAKKEGFNKPSAVASRTYTAGGGAGYTGPLATWGNTAFTVTDDAITNSKISSDLCGTNATLGAKSSDGTLQKLTKTSHNSGAVYVVYYNASAGSYWEITLPITEKIVSGTKINLSYNAAVNKGGITSWTAYCNENAMGDPVTIAEDGSPKALSDLTAVSYSYTLTSDVASGSSIIIKIKAADSGSSYNTRITNISVSAD